MISSLSRRTFTAGSATIGATLAARGARAQSTPETSPSASPTAVEAVEIPPFTVPADATPVKIGFLPIMIYAPIYIAFEKGYYAERNLNVEVAPTNSGTDLAVMTSTNDLQIALSGVGPAFWNGIETQLPLKIVAPGHEEGNPVATPLMVPTASDAQSAADLKGKRVSVNAPGATEYWLQKALETGGLNIGDVELQYLTFPDAVTAMASGALDAAMIGEPLATSAVNDGLARILSNDFDVQGMQVTAVYANSDWVSENPEPATSFVAAYIQACRDLMDAPNDPLNLTIINKYTYVPLELIAESVRPVYEINGAINNDNLVTLQEFFRDRDLLNYDQPIDPTSVIDQEVIDAAVEEIGKR